MFYWQKIFYCQKTFTIKKFLLKNFLQSKKNFQKRIISAKEFLPKNLKYFCCLKNFLLWKKKNFTIKNFLLTKKIFCYQKKFLLSKKFLAFKKFLLSKKTFFDYDLFIFKKITIMAGILNHTIVDFYWKKKLAMMLKKRCVTRFITFNSMMTETRALYSFIIMNTDCSNKKGTHWWSFLDLHPNFFFILQFWVWRFQRIDFKG